MGLSWSALANLALVRLEWFTLGYFLLVNSHYGALLLSAAYDTWLHVLTVRGERRRWILGSDIAPSISVLVPAHNETATIRESVLSILTLDYPNLEVVVVNDGSTDGTLAVLTEQFELAPIHPIYQKLLHTKPVRGLYLSRTHPNLVVVDKEGGGKADAMNVGLTVASGHLVCVIDADTLIEPDALQHMVWPFLGRNDLLAAGGTIRPANSSRVRWGRVVEPQVPRRALAGFQVVEYLRAFLFGRLGWNRLGGNLIIAGAFGLFLREAVIAAGGYASDMVAEDTELILRLRRNGYEAKGPSRVQFIPDPVAWTEAPESLRFLGRQRNRWHRGLANALWRHRRLLLNPRYGVLGLVVFPSFFFVELLAPVVEALGLLGLGIALLLRALDWHFALLFFLLAYGYDLVLTALTLMLEAVSYRRYDRPGDYLLLLIWMLLAPLGYRQLTVYWRLRGLVDSLRKRTHWDVMEHRGFGIPATPAGPQ